MNQTRICKLSVAIALLVGCAACGGWYTRWGIADEKELHEFKSVPKLLKAVQDGSCHELMRASEVLYQFGEQARSAMWALESGMRREACSFRKRIPAAKALGRLGRGAKPILDKALAGKTSELRYLAVVGFGEMRYKQDEVVAMLVEKLGSTDPMDHSAREEAFFSLGKHGKAAIPAIPILVDLLATKDWRFQAMDALLAIGHPSRKAIDGLKALAASSKDPEFRTWVMERHDKLIELGRKQTK